MRTHAVAPLATILALVTGIAPGCERSQKPPEQPGADNPAESPAPAEAPPVRRMPTPGPFVEADSEDPDKALVAEAARFADEACKCEDTACADAVSSAFNDWAAARGEVKADPEVSRALASHAARMGGCLRTFEATALPLQGKPCTESEECAEGLTCIKYFGIAGPRGPKFTSCEIPCAGKTRKCPGGQTCMVISDGPGQVCRPTGR